MTFKLLAFFLVLLALAKLKAQVPKDFVDIKSINPRIQVDLRYYTDWNFIGRKIKYYKANKCYLTKNAALALSKAQDEFQKNGYSILLFDCYRPQTSVKEFVEWVKDEKDQKMKPIFYAEIPKNQIIKKGYLSSKSAHSRGSTVDLTLIHSNQSATDFSENTEDCRKPNFSKKSAQVNMGTLYDCFSIDSHTKNAKTKTVRKNRQLLKETMEKFGFENYSKEWWHFSLKDEPFKEDSFDFAIK